MNCETSSGHQDGRITGHHQSSGQKPGARMPVVTLLMEDHSNTPIMAKIISMVMRPTTRLNLSTAVT